MPAMIITHPGSRPPVEHPSHEGRLTGVPQVLTDVPGRERQLEALPPAGPRGEARAAGRSTLWPHSLVGSFGASTEKVSLSLDTGAVLLARRAAALEGLSLSAYLSQLVRRHAWASQRPHLDPDEQAGADRHTVELDEREASQWRGEGERRAAG